MSFGREINLLRPGAVRAAQMAAGFGQRVGVDLSPWGAMPSIDSSLAEAQGVTWATEVGRLMDEIDRIIAGE